MKDCSSRGRNGRGYYRAFVEGLQERGLIEGKNIALEWRFAHGDNERLQALAQEPSRARGPMCCGIEYPLTSFVHRPKELLREGDTFVQSTRFG